MPKKPEALTPEELETIEVRRAAARAKARGLIEDADRTEDAAVIAAAEADPDAPPATDEQLARMRPAHEVLPGVVAAHIRRPRGRPKVEIPKRQVTIRLDADVLEALRATGTGWQTRVNEVLRKWLTNKGS